MQKYANEISKFIDSLENMTYKTEKDEGRAVLSGHGVKKTGDQVDFKLTIYIDTYGAGKFAFEVNDFSVFWNAELTAPISKLYAKLYDNKFEEQCKYHESKKEKALALFNS